MFALLCALRVLRGEKFLMVAVLALISFLVFSSSSAETFKSQQLRYPRVRAAFAAKEKTIAATFREKGIPYPPKRIFLRVFKLDHFLELWAQSNDGRFGLVKKFAICYSSGEAGPKRKLGDSQVPEGFYSISSFNPQSQFLLSLKVDYPNASDRILGVKGNLGGDIYIHGDCVSIGCVSLTDEGIQELYPVVVMARSAGQTAVPVHIFPCRMDERGLARLRALFPAQNPLWPFWNNLREGFDFFEKNRTLSTIGVGKDGRYQFKP
jgi:murein L,D-transpeptidase YafK